jgi:hypothetical protein
MSWTDLLNAKGVPFAAAGNGLKSMGFGFRAPTWSRAMSHSCRFGGRFCRVFTLH